LKQLQEWLRDWLAPYQFPTELRVVEMLPRNAMGKVNKKELKKAIFGQ
jgi:malonyl-CoA/methylmalonyl-CoA synthetase